MISKSPERFSFQKEGYLSRKAEEGKTPENDPNVKAIVEYYESQSTKKDQLESSPEWRKNNLEWDLRTTDWILEKVRSSDAYAQNLYAALCNMQWCKKEMWPLLKEDYWSCSWRSAGGIIADMQQKGDYIDWYCSGMGGVNQEYDQKETAEEWSRRTGYVAESVVTEEIENDLNRLGWIPVPYKEEVI